jgi:hypothetical protein
MYKYNAGQDPQFLSKLKARVNSHLLHKLATNSQYAEDSANKIQQKKRKEKSQWSKALSVLY